MEATAQGAVPAVGNVAESQPGPTSGVAPGTPLPFVVDANREPTARTDDLDRLKPYNERMAFVLVERTKVYPRPARPGRAWHYVYTVTIPGEPHSFSGERMSWVRQLVRRKAPNLRIILGWEQ